MAEVIAGQVRDMFASIARRYDLTNSVLSFGLHHLWKRAVARRLPVGTARTLDLCTGTGDLIPLLASRTQELTAGDFCAPMLEVARQRGLDRMATLVQCDALSLPFAEGAFNVVTCAFGVRNLESLERGLKEMRRVLAPGGALIVLEFGQPNGPLFGPLYRFYSRRVMPMVGGVLTGNRAAYEYLPETAKAFPCGMDFTRIAEQCGFSEATSTPLTGGIAWLYECRI